TEQIDATPVPRLRHTPAARPGLEASLDGGHANSRSSGPNALHFPDSSILLNVISETTQTRIPKGFRRTQRDGDQLGGTGPTRRDRSNIAVARFLDMPRRI